MLSFVADSANRVCLPLTTRLRGGTDRAAATSRSLAFIRYERIERPVAKEEKKGKEEGKPPWTAGIPETARIADPAGNSPS